MKKSPKSNPCLPFQTRSSHRSEWVDLQKMEGSQLPFHRWVHRGPTSPQLCYSPEKIQDRHCHNWVNSDRHYIQLKKQCVGFRSIWQWDVVRNQMNAPEYYNAFMQCLRNVGTRLANFDVIYAKNMTNIWLIVGIFLLTCKGFGL